MSKQRELSREEVLNLIREREETGISTVKLVEKNFMSQANLYKTIAHYGLKREWENAMIRYEKKTVQYAIWLRKYEGLSLEEIDKRINITMATLYRWATKHKLTEKFNKAKQSGNYNVFDAPKGKDKRPIPLSWLYTQRVVFGRSYKEIAEEFKCTPSRIELECKRRNFKKPPKHVYLKHRENVNRAIDTDWDKLEMN